MVFDDQKSVLEGGGLRCAELVKALEKLGFKVRDGSLGGHKVISHPGIPGFHGSNFNCGHRSTEQVLPVYIRKMLRLVENYETDIRKYLGEDNDN